MMEGDQPSKKKRIMKTQEQLDVLHELRLKGMSSVRDKAMIAEAMQRTDLPESCIKDWISNQNKPDRGSSKKHSSNLNIYSAYMTAPASDFQAEGIGLGQLAKVRAVKYNELKSTDDGMDFLRENLKKMNNPDRDELTDAQRHGRAKGIYDRMKEEAEKLDNLGYKAGIIVAQPDGSPAFLGHPSAVYFFANRQKVSNDYLQYVSDGTGPVDSKEVLCLRVRQLFNRLYAETTGQKKKAMPYKAIDAGLDVQMFGLPPSITFKQPQSYTLSELKRILFVEPSIHIKICGQKTPSSPPNEGITATSLPMDQGDSAAVEDEGDNQNASANGNAEMVNVQPVVSAASSPQGIQAEVVNVQQVIAAASSSQGIQAEVVNVQQVIAAASSSQGIQAEVINVQPTVSAVLSSQGIQAEMVNVQPVVSAELSSQGIQAEMVIVQPSGSQATSSEDMQDPREITEVDRFLASVMKRKRTGHGECQVTTEENASLVEEVVPTQETKKPAPQRKSKRRTEKTIANTNAEDLVGKKIRHLWEMIKPKQRQWYNGLVLMLSGDIYYILYEDDEVPYPEPVEIIQKGLTKGTVIVL